MFQEGQQQSLFSVLLRGYQLYRLELQGISADTLQLRYRPVQQVVQPSTDLVSSLQGMQQLQDEYFQVAYEGGGLLVPAEAPGIQSTLLGIVGHRGQTGLVVGCQEVGQHGQSDVPEIQVLFFLFVLSHLEE